MKQLYEMVNISKQGHLSFIDRHSKEEQDNMLILSAIAGLRVLHPQMGAKKMYELLRPENIGRDKFITFAVANGYGVQRIRNFQKTTHSSRIYKYQNLINGLVVYDINNVWVSDITYFELGDTFYYLTFIEDVYSRRIIGSIAYPTLQAKANLYALNIALKTRGISSYQSLIHHSDRGVQYTSNEYVKVLESRNIKISMCSSVYENAFVERVNGIIKNEYLNHWTINDYPSLKQKLKLAVYLYNNERPHWNLGKMTPLSFENYIKELPIEKRKGLHMYTIDNEEKDLINVNQLCLFD